VYFVFDVIYTLSSNCMLNDNIKIHMITITRCRETIFQFCGYGLICVWIATGFVPSCVFNLLIVKSSIRVSVIIRQHLVLMLSCFAWTLLLTCSLIIPVVSIGDDCGTYVSFIVFNISMWLFGKFTSILLKTYYRIDVIRYNKLMAKLVAVSEADSVIQHSDVFIFSALIANVTILSFLLSRMSDKRNRYCSGDIVYSFYSLICYIIVFVIGTVDRVVFNSIDRTTNLSSVSASYNDIERNDDSLLIENENEHDDS
jgi:hypothetical protein